MKENFLHFVWQHQYFDKKDLLTCAGEEVSIFAIGYHNTNSGPDFQQARLEINGVTWYGSVEIHILASDWLVHNHQNDQAYDNVVLHVVWENDKEIMRTDGSRIPTLELKHRIDQRLLHKYTDLVSSRDLHIPCSHSLDVLPDIVKISMFDTALIGRLEDKASGVLEIVGNCQGDWEEASFRVLCRNFGFKLNSEAFYELSKRIPFSIVKKHADSLFQIEALLFGQSGMLDANYKDEYAQRLQNEYAFLSAKYSLQESKMLPSVWKFLRTRPANFPTIRIAQLAAIVSKVPNLFSHIREVEELNQFISTFSIKPSEYWQKHYAFDKTWEKEGNNLGLSSLQNIVINTIVPVIAAYGQYYNREEYMEKAIAWLENIPAEENKISKTWKSLGLSQRNAGETQAGIELFNNFCKNRLCLNCQIGVAVINKI
jgi:hypothetical protein